MNKQINSKKLIKSKHSRNILNELKWKGMDMSECQIEYIHRGAHDDTKTVSCGDIIDIGRSFFTVFPDTLIPYHRIRRIRFKGKTIYIKTTPEQTPEK